MEDKEDQAVLAPRASQGTRGIPGGIPAGGDSALRLPRGTTRGSRRMADPRHMSPSRRLGIGTEENGVRRTAFPLALTGSRRGHNIVLLSGRGSQFIRPKEEDLS